MVYTLNMGVLNYCDMIIYIHFLLQAHICNTLLKILRLLKTLRRVILKSFAYACEHRWVARSLENPPFLR